MDGSQAVFLNHFLGNEDRVLKVVTVPGHERDTHVLPQSQLTQIHGRAVSQHVTTGNFIALVNNGALVDTGVLVRTGVLGEVVDIHTSITGFSLIVVDTYHDTGRIDALDHTTATSGYANARVLGHGTLNTSTYQGHLRTQRRNRLALHVGAHQCTVGVVVFQERNQRGCYRHYLAR